MIEQSSKSHNKSVDICRFVAAFLIVIHHSDRIGGPSLAPVGWVFVELFFMLSGYYTTRHFDQKEYDKEINCEKLALEYTIKKIKRAFPYALVGVVLHSIVMLIDGTVPVQEHLRFIAEIPFHLCFLNILGFLKYHVNIPIWYLSSLLLTTPVLAILLLRHKNIYKYLISWIAPCLCYMIVYRTHGELNYWGIGWGEQCLLRAIAGQCLGSVVYFICIELKNMNNQTVRPFFFSIVSIVTFLIVLLIAFSNTEENFVPTGIALEFLYLCIILSGLDSLGERLPNFSTYLGRISLPMFCVNIPAYVFIEWCFKDNDFSSKMMLSVLLTLFLSCLLLWLVDHTIGENE